MTLTSTRLSSRPASLKTRFFRRFLRSLLRMKTYRHSSSSLDNIRQERARRIKISAYSSMAFAVGSRRAWSRALIFKIRRNRAFRHHHGFVRKKRLIFGVKNKRIINGAAKKPLKEQNQAMNKLRGIVPGGETMELCNLLEETAHYIKCLATQVKVMQEVADAFSTD